MKIEIYAQDFFDILPQYKQILLPEVEMYNKLLEDNNYNIDKIKDKKAKEIFATQLSTKEDFNIEVIEQNGNWEIKNFDKDILVSLLLRNDSIVLNYDTKSLDNINLLEYIKHKYEIYVKQYEQVNYIGEGKINWTDINNEVKSNWDKSFFFLDNMNDQQFVENNKELILEKVKDDNNLLKEALTKSNSFFEYACNNISVPTLLQVLSDNPSYLCSIWNNKVKSIQNKSDSATMIKKEKEDMNEQLNECWNYLMQNSFNSYGDLEDGGQYDRLKVRINKQLKEREKQIKLEAEKNQVIVKQIDKLLENNELRKNLIIGLLKNDIFKDDFVRFENDIINNETYQALVINKGLYKTLATTKNFVSSLSEEQFERFIITCSQRLERSAFKSDDKKYFEKIVNEEKLLSALTKVIKEGKVSADKFKLNNHQDWKILDQYNAKNEQLKHCLFFMFPKERFVELSKNEITEDDIKHYLKCGGTIYMIKEKINMYELKDIEIIKILCAQDSDILKSKKAPSEWRNNIEIIKEIVINKGDLKYSGIKKENILQACKDINETIEIVREDKHHYVYENLPEKIKNNKRVALALLESTKEPSEVIKLLPEFILKDKRFNIEIIKKSPNAISYLQSNIWNDKEFVLTLLHEVENTPKEKEVGKNLPLQIQLFFETFNIKENYYTFFNNYQLQKRLEEKLVSQEGKIKEKRMKI